MFLKAYGKLKITDELNAVNIDDGTRMFHQCKQTVNFSTFNTRTLNSKSKLGEITALSEKYAIDVTYIQEHRMYHDDINIKHHDMGKGGC